MRNLLACTCLTPLALLAVTGTAARAETTITTKVTTGQKSSTIKAGAADDLRITSAGSVVLAAGGGAAVTLDSNNKITNEGAIQTNDLNDVTGILVNGGTTGTVTNSGKIELLESYAPTDADKDGDLDGALARGARRIGIRIAPGGTFTGNIVNSGSISIEGNDSAGIALDGALAGSLTQSGTIAVVGDRAVGVRAGAVSGDVRITGATGATGLGATAVSLDGNIGGAFVIQAAVASTGYRATTAPSDVSKLDADDLLQGGPAVRVGADVAKGIFFDVPPKDSSATDNDEDKDGVEDSKEGSAAVTSYGAAPALLVGSATRTVTIGAVAGNANGHGMVLNGTIAGRGVYSGVEANGIVIGGLGQAVNVAGGMTVTGAVGAVSNAANATGIRIGSDATVNEIRVSGSVTAQGASTASTISRGIVVDQGATVTAIRNSGTIGAAASGAGSASAIVDNSGKIALVENSGAITIATLGLDTGRAVAIDLRSNNAGAVVRQTTVGQGVTAPSISGDILFGAGDDQLDLADGKVLGTSRFGTGANRLTMAGDAEYSGSAVFGSGADRMSLAGTSVFSGSADFGGGADVLALSGTARFSGSLLNATGLAVDVAGGTLELSGTGTAAIASLNVGATGVLGVTLDPAAGKSSLYQVAGNAAFAQGSKLQVRLNSVSGSLGTYTVLKAGSLTGTAGLTSTSVLLPVFLKSSLTANEQAGEIKVAIARKTAAEIGLNRSEAGAWDAVYSVLDKDTKLAGAFLQMSETETFRDSIQQLLPEHAGGVFETVTQASRATARMLRDPGAPYFDAGQWGFWVQQVAWGTSKNLGDTSEYDITGWGANGGAEIALGSAGRIGASLSYLSGRDEGINDSEVRTDQYELGVHWRGEWGGFRSFVRGSAAAIKFDGTRHFSGVVNGEEIRRTSTGEWDGRLYSAAAGISYEAAFGRFSLRPLLAIDYYRLTEDGYAESGGGNAMDLTVDKRKSDEFAGEASLTLGYDFKERKDRDSGFFRVEIEGGRRQILGGDIGATTARFGSGTAFTLLPEKRTDGWTGKLRLIGGSGDFSIGGEVGAEEQQGRAAVSGRIALQIGF
ncbi:autotransporter domain-containing protein [Sphingosinicella sp. BN140058]|uniref:autotransporter outer membrane beta-barrel domain-containing protein n=1 Tax=Sphingosinicella sp. BN140058 TaxID=1892855 RepID=UPI0010103A21|nr:autotransporter outer membrane beta-barrel domain-containing protein [Sphingosinicella sp. BN140058]QAY78243.1 autotransporter outer membrane beta-barrel domain-containing protein [Sphingosinicella sp. BN140058]